MSIYINYVKQSLTVNGDANGIITVSDARAYRKGATVYLDSDTQPTVELMVDKILSTTELVVKEPAYYIYYGFNASAYTIADNAVLTQPPQFDLNTWDDEETTSTGGGSGTVDQGLPAMLANGWPVKITDGTSVLGTLANPIRINPTGTTAQPVTDNGGSLTVDGTVSAAQSGTWNINNISGTISLPTGAATEATLATLLTGATFTSRINTLGQKTMANSTPVVIASDQSAVPVSGTVTANQGTSAAVTGPWYVRLSDGTDPVATLAKPISVYTQEQVYTATYTYSAGKLTRIQTVFTDGRTLRKDFTYTGADIATVTTTYL